MQYKYFFTVSDCLALLALLALLAAACATSSRAGVFDDPNLEAGVGPGPGDGGFFVGDVTLPTEKRTGCSGDLRSIIDEAGVVLSTCGDSEGCAAGGCVPACEAAAASRGSIGCDYTIATPAFHHDILPPCFSVFIANNWPAAVNVEVSYEGQSYDVTKFGRIPSAGSPPTSWPAVSAQGILPGEVAVLFLSDDPASMNGSALTCPIAPAIRRNKGTAAVGTARGTAWKIKSSLPVTAYDIIPFGGAPSFLPSATLILPTSSWGKNYLGIVPPKGTNSLPQWAQVVALEDGTTVDVLPSVNLPAGPGVPAATKGAKASYSLKAGEFVQWVDTGEMSSTVIQANKAVAFTGGHEMQCYRSATSIDGGCDSGHQMIPPVQAMGFEYAVAPYKTRFPTNAEESIVYRIVGAADGTQLTFNPAVSGADTTLSAGQTVDFEASGSFVVKSQDANHPFYVGQTMGGSGLLGAVPGISPLGDDDFVNVLPPAQFLAKYVFFTDPSYKTTTLTVVRRKAGSSFKDVKLACLTAPISGWKPVGGSGDYEFAHVTLVSDGQGQGGCKNGPQVAESTGPFGVTVWGMDVDASYAYPAGGNVAPINSVVVPALPK